MVLQVLRVLLDPLEQPVLKALLEHRELKALQALQVLQVHMVLQDQLGLLEQQVLKVI